MERLVRDGDHSQHGEQQPAKKKTKHHFHLNTIRVPKSTVLKGVNPQSTHGSIGSEVTSSVHSSETSSLLPGMSSSEPSAFPALCSSEPANDCQPEFIPMEVAETRAFPNPDQLLDILHNYEAALQPTVIQDNPDKLSGYMRKNVEYQRISTAWKARQEKKEEEFKQQRVYLRNKLIEFTVIRKIQCTECRLEPASIRCRTCRHHACNKCDEKIHKKVVTHQRVTMLPDGSIYILLPTEFLDDIGSVVFKGIPLPLFEPDECSQCGEKGVIRMECGSRKVILVSKEGRFDLYSTSFRCISCNSTREATNEEYMSSDFWPGSLSNNTYFFDGQLLKLWYHLRNKTPGTSERKFIEALEEVSSEGNRINIINRTLFSRGRREYEYNQYWIEKNILRRHGTCNACGDDPLGVHADGNFKLYRYKEAKDRQGESLYGSDIMAEDDTQINHQKRIEAEIPTKGDSLCGASTFKAARPETARSKTLDITGLEMMSCSHGTILYSANMFKGETYKHTHLQHIFAHDFNAKFFCSDVICKYWPFAEKVGNKFPEYSSLTKRMIAFLSPFHGRAHTWDCRVEWNGHWQEGAADMLGEEQEQVFSVVSRKASTTKHESRAVRRDDLSSLFFYLNREKENRMVMALCKWYERAKTRAPIYEAKLQALLNERAITVKDLPGIHDSLKKQALLVKDKHLSSKWSTDQLQRELEGECHMIRVLQNRNLTTLEHCKERTANRRLMSKKKARITSIVELLRKSGVAVTPDQIEVGIFDWHNDGSKTSVAKDYNLVETWMLSLRYKEAILQNRTEMAMYVKSLKRIRTLLEEDIKTITGDGEIDNEINRSRIAMARVEITRLNGIMRTAIHQFKECLQHEEIEQAEESILKELDTTEDGEVDIDDVDDYFEFEEDYNYEEDDYNDEESEEDFYDGDEEFNSVSH